MSLYLGVKWNHIKDIISYVTNAGRSAKCVGISVYYV